MFEITIPEGLEILGVVLADKVKSLDYKTQRAEFACQMPDEILMQVIIAIIAINRMMREV